MKISVTTPADAAVDAGYAGPCRATGVRESQAFGPPGYSLALTVADLEAGGQLVWDGFHGDEAVYLLEGELDVDGRRCPTSGALVVESDAVATATAVGPARVAHFFPRDPTPPTGGLYGPADPDGHGVHVVGPGGWFSSGEAEGVDARWFADSTCQRCRLTLIRVARDTPHYRSRGHSHSQDELMYVVHGSIRMGNTVVEAGSAVAIPADVWYGFTAGADGYAFLNYRADASLQTYDRQAPPIPEGGLARGGVAVNDLR